MNNILISKEEIIEMVDNLFHCYASSYRNEAAESIKLTLDKYENKEIK